MKQPLQVHLMSFSFKKGLPAYTSEHGGGYIFDCRGIKNPGRIDSYKTLTGLDAPVRQYLQTQTQMPEFLALIEKLVYNHIDDYLSRGFTELSIAFGCTGGQHRSVYSAQTLYEALQKKYPQIIASVKHRELGK